MKRLIYLTLAIGVVIATTLPSPKTNAVEPKDDRPFFALWSRDHGRRTTPALRFAFWDDGRVVFAKDPTKWDSELQRGKVAAYRVARLKNALTASGIFSLKGNCYLVPDGGVDCLIVDVGGKQQMLYWDEVESPNYGINIDPKPHHLEFIRCWKLLNSLGLVACPDQFEAFPEKFKPAKSWYLKPPIQSE